MKTMKYRSILATITAVALSVFLFTSCEKESDNPGSSNGDRLEKFKRLQFSTASTSSTTNSGSGTFVGNGNNVSFVSTDGPKANFTPASSGNSNGFTDPKSTGTSFIVDQSFGFGGGSVTIDGKEIDLDFAFCAEADFLGVFNSNDTTENENELNLFVGISGDFSLDSSSSDGIDLILYVFSYNGGSEIGNFLDFESGEFDEGAFVIAVAYEEDEQGNREQILYFGTEGSVIFDGSNVLLSTVEMMKVEEGNDGHSLGSETATLDAALECITYEEESK